jgi:hypothetical protein
MSENKSFPQFACSDCYNTVIYTKDFMKICQDSELKLTEELDLLKPALSPVQYSPCDFDSSMLDTHFSEGEEEDMIKVDEDVEPKFKKDLSSQRDRLTQNLTNAILNMNEKILTKQEVTEEDEVEEPEKKVKVGKRKKESDFTCCKCEIKFENGALLMDHSKYHELEYVPNPEKPYPCRICFTSFSKESNANYHWRKSKARSGDKLLKKVEELVVKHQSELELEQTTEKRCCGCKAVFMTEQELYNHSILQHKLFQVNTEHLKKPVECNICFKRFKTQLLMEQHKLTPYRIKGFNCEKCHKRFTAPQFLRAHMANHSDEQFECDLCGKILKTKANLRNHINQIHLNRQTFICPEVS